MMLQCQHEIEMLKAGDRSRPKFNQLTQNKLLMDFLNISRHCIEEIGLARVSPLPNQR